MLICKDNKAFALGNYCTEGFIVYKGSRVSDHTTKSFELNSYNDLRNYLINNKIIVNRVFTSDYIFASLSAAACVVEGRMTSGPKAWKEVKKEK